MTDRSDAARWRWAQTPPEVQQAHVDNSHAAFRARYPAFVATYEQAMADPQPCADCGDAARPLVDLATGALIAWRCYPCRRARKHGRRRNPPEGCRGAEGCS